MKYLASGVHGKIVINRDQTEVKKIHYPMPGILGIAYPSEYDITMRLSHPNLLHAICIDADGHLVFPYYPYTLEDYCVQSLPLIRRQDLFYQIKSGLQYLHSQGYLHLDLKEDNILVSSDLQTAVIADFGLSFFVGRNGKKLTLHRGVCSAQTDYSHLETLGSRYLHLPIKIESIDLLPRSVEISTPITFQDKRKVMSFIRKWIITLFPIPVEAIFIGIGLFTRTKNKKISEDLTLATSIWIGWKLSTGFPEDPRVIYPKSELISGLPKEEKRIFKSSNGKLYLPNSYTSITSRNDLLLAWRNLTLGTELEIKGGTLMTVGHLISDLDYIT